MMLLNIIIQDGDLKMELTEPQFYFGFISVLIALILIATLVYLAACKIIDTIIKNKEKKQK